VHKDGRVPGDFGFGGLGSSLCGSRVGAAAPGSPGGVPGPRYRPGAGLIEQIRSGDIYRFGGARAPGRDWAFGWKETITDPALSTYDIRDFQERMYGEATTSPDLPALRRFVDLAVGVNLNQAGPVTDGRHWKVSLLPGEMFMHPSSTNQLPTARFTVPTAGEYTITGFSQNIGCGGTIKGVVSVVSSDQAKPGMQILAERASNGSEAPYKIIRTFSKGDLIDFSVDAAGSYLCDSTRLDAQIVPSQRVAPDASIGAAPAPAPGPGVKSEPPQSSKPSQATGGQAQAGPGTSKPGPASSGGLDLQVQWELWPDKRTQPKPSKPDQSAKKPLPPADVVKPPKADVPSAQPAPPPERQQPDQPKPEPTKAEPPKPQPKPQPKPPQQQPGGVSSVDYSPLFARGVAKAALGDKRGAIADFNQVIAINPKLAPAYYSRGLAKWDLNDKTGACADFNMARQLGDVSAAAAERKACLP